ncbi:MAG TPA: MoxR family ATPase [Zeimonas sp.]
MRTHALRSLALHGLDQLDAVVVAALASEEPLLLVGPHGSAKSALLNRIAAALGLEHRHYNASLLSFDDLLGFPLPNEARTGLQYLRTPATLWDAESVFLDEISRCRPEVQNKLFSIVHERRVMGVALERLRYRWAAMNPPAAFDASGDIDDAYLGSQPLDPALADRFAFVVELPTLAEMAPADRRRLIAHGDDFAPVAMPPLRALVDAAHERQRLSLEAFDDWVVGYVDSLVAPLAEVGLPMSGRRAAMLRRSIRFVHGAREALGCAKKNRPSQAQATPNDETPEPTCTIDDSALEALRWGLPHRARGRAAWQESTLLALHRHAVELAGEPLGSPRARLRNEPNPVRRIALALAMPEGTLSRTAFSALVADTWAAQDVAGRYLLARRLLPVLAERDVANAPTLEMLAEPLGRVLDFERDATHRMQLTRAEVTRYNELLAVLAKLDASDEREASLGNVLYTLFAVEQASFDAKEVIARDAQFARWFVQCREKSADDAAKPGSRANAPRPTEGARTAKPTRAAARSATAKAA